MTFFYDFGNRENGAVVRWMHRVAGKEEVSTRAASSVGLAEVARVAVYRQDHVAG